MVALEAAWADVSVELVIFNGKIFNCISNNSANYIDTHTHTHTPFFLRGMRVPLCSFMHHPRIVNTLAGNNKSIVERALRKRYLTLASSITSEPLYTVNLRYSRLHK